MKRSIALLTLLFAMSANALNIQEADIENMGVTGKKTIVLTFDDGPGVGTARILDTLKKYHVHATFFAVGEMVGFHPALADRIVAEGNVLANHSFHHPNMVKENAATIFQEIKTSHEKIAPHLRPGAKLFFRAPYGAWKTGVSDLLNADPVLSQYIGPIYWNVGKNIERNADGSLANAGDWACWLKAPRGLSEEDCMAGYLAKIESENGGVVLMHDIHAKTADMLEKLLPILIERGYRFETLDDLSALDIYAHTRPLEYDEAGKVKNF